MIYLRKSDTNLRLFSLNKNISALVTPGLFLFLVIMSSCNPTKYVPKGEALLDRNFIHMNEAEVKMSDVETLLKQKPNKRIFGARFHLGLYNLSNIEKERWPHSWLRNIGEEPVVFDADGTQRSIQQIKTYLDSKGYFKSKVDETIELSKGRAKVYYNVETGTPYIISSLKYEVEDTTLMPLINFDSVNCMIEKGHRYDLDIISAERNRIVRYIQDHGFYGFSPEHVFFKVDSTLGNRRVGITFGIRKGMRIDPSGRVQMVPHEVYRVRDVYIYPEFYPREALSGSEDFLVKFDTTEYNGYKFVTPPGRQRIRPEVITQSLFIKPGYTFNFTQKERTLIFLNYLKVHRLVNINYNELPPSIRGNEGEKMLDAVIQLTPFDQQSFTWELEGTNSLGNLGGAVNFIYQHKNLFHGAEQFSIKLKGAYETLSGETGFRNTQEFGIEASLKLPRFLIPFINSENFVRRYNPRSVFQVAYNYQKVPFYTRTVANASFGYTWNKGNYTTHTIRPAQINIVKLPFIDPEFEQRIDTSSFLSFSYKDVMIMGGSYSYVFNNQKIKKSRDFWNIKINAEAAGNLPAAFSRISGPREPGEVYQILGQTFAQYIRTDFNIAYNTIINDASSIVYRSFIGLGIPYGNSRVMPFEKQYFGGGSSGIRAWQVRSLGPGSYSSPESSFLNQTGDIKLELNAEYRFKLFWIMEGATFVDAGNIWTFNEDYDRPGSSFKFNRLIDDMAIGTGFGLRFDVSFVLLRADLGIKLRDPALNSASKWIRSNRPYNFKEDFTLVLGIGYPF